MEYQNLENKEFTFEDGAKIRVIQVKNRDTGTWVTYEVIYPMCLPKRHVDNLNSFIGNFGHLFNTESKN